MSGHVVLALPGTATPVGNRIVGATRAHPGAGDHRGMSRGLTSLVAVIAFVVAGVALGLAATKDPSSTTAFLDGARAAGIADRALDVEHVYRATAPGVVDITATLTANTGPVGLDGTQPSQAGGAGVVYNTRGDILTAEHVVRDASSVTVSFSDGRVTSGRVVGSDPSTDVAVIRVDVPARTLHPIPLADSATVRVGDPVVAIGSPFGLPGTVTSGIVSAMGRSIPAPNGFTILEAIQTDASMNPGNSGGPLVDANGGVIGLADQMATTDVFGSGQSSGVGFATPANMVAKVADLIIASKPVRHAYIGASLNPVSLGGAEIAGVPPKSPAAEGGLKRGDVVTAIDGKPIAFSGQLTAELSSYKPGDTVVLTVRRQGRSLAITVTFGTQPKTLTSG
jgi:S1-C subfamily serine protease